MSIHLAIEEGTDWILQGYGRKYADKLTSEDAISSSLQKVLRQRTWAGYAIAVSSASFAASVAVCLLDRIPTGFHGFVGVALASSVLLALCSLLLRSDLSNRARLHSALSTEKDLCVKLSVLAAQSPAVTGYVRSVTTSGRQLRVFDVARANVVLDSEQYRLAQEYADDACVSLHSL